MNKKRNILYLLIFLVGASSFVAHTVYSSTQLRDGSVLPSTSNMKFNNQLTARESNALQEFDMNRADTTPTDGDKLGEVYFEDKNSAGTVYPYASMSGYASDVTNGTEDGRVDFKVASAGVLVLHTYFLYNGNVGCDGVFSNNAFDLAEDYPVEEGLSLEPGDVVVAGNGGFIQKSSKPYEQRIIGVISPNSAKLTNTNLEPDANGRMPGLMPVALLGRVEVNISLENGDIHVGDPLTSSSTPGIAMKATDAGPVIGKALEACSSKKDKSIMAFIRPDWYCPENQQQIAAAKKVEALTSKIAILRQNYEANQEKLGFLVSQATEEMSK